MTEVDKLMGELNELEAERDNVVKAREALLEKPYGSADYKISLTNGHSIMSAYVVIVGDELAEADVSRSLVDAFGIEAIERYLKRAKEFDLIPRLELLKDEKDMTLIITMNGPMAVKGPIAEIIAEECACVLDLYWQYHYGKEFKNSPEEK